MKKLKRLIVLALSLCLLLSVAGCGESGDAVMDVVANLRGELSASQAQSLVQNNLDAIYLNKASDEYAQMVDSTREEIEAQYWDGIAIEIDVFKSYFSIVIISDEQTERLEKFYDEVYSHSSYTVGDPTKNENGSYSVTVTVQPIDIMNAIVDTVTGKMDSFPQYTEDEVNNMTDEEYEQYESQWTEMIISSAEESLVNIGNLEDTEVEMKVSKIDGLWQLTTESMSAIDMVIVDYP